MNFLFNIETLNQNNVYMIKKISNIIWYNFNLALNTKNKIEAGNNKRAAELLRDKVKSNLLWVNKIDKMILEMMRKLNG